MSSSPSKASTLLSTWARQKDLPAIDPDLVEQPLKAPGACIGGYQMVKRLGEGEFAAVYQCVRPGKDGAFACKAILKERVQRHTSLHKSKRNITRVNTEVMAMRRFKHAGVCRLHDVIQSPQYVYLVLEKGDRDLYSFLDGYAAGCDEDVIRSVMRITALGLRHCHHAGIAHRDIKPENILVVGTPKDWAKAGDDPAKMGVVKLCDFGLCADISDGRQLTDFVGSPGFFAPELLLAKSYDGARADIWSLGAVMLEMLLGHEVFTNLWCPPYDYLHDDDAFRDGVTETVVQIKLGSTQCAPSPALRMLVDQLLDISPDKRSTIDEICETKYFDLMTMAGAAGAAKLLRLTYDQSVASFADKPEGSLRPVGRRKRITLSRVDVPAITRSIKITNRVDLAKGAEPPSPKTPLADAPLAPPSLLSPTSAARAPFDDPAPGAPPPVAAA